MVVSKSFASRRLRPNQPRVRSTTQRRGSTSKPLAWSDRLTISSVHWPSPARAVSRFLAGVSAVRKDVTQPGEEIADRCQHSRRPVAILDVGCVHLGADQMPTGVSDDMALAALDLFARVVTARTPAFGGLDRLAIDHSGRGAGFATLAFAGNLQQKEIDLLPQTLFLPRVKVVLHGRPLRKIARQQTPRTRRSQNIQQSLHNLPQLYFSGSAQYFLGRHMGLNQGPFRIRHIACVTKLFASILTASGFGPHVVSPRAC